MKGKLTKKLMMAIGLSMVTMAYPIAQVVAEPAGSLYRVRESANNSASQIGAYRNLEYAKALADASNGYEVYNENGALVYAPSTASYEVKEVEETTVAKETKKVEETERKIETVATNAKQEDESDSYVINSSVNRYATAYDASVNSNSVGSYTAGTYYVYKSANGMLNISRIKGTPGSWVNPNGVTEVKTTTTAPKATTAAKSTTAPKTTTATKATTAATTATTAARTTTNNSSAITIAQGTLKYATAYDASVNSNSVGTYTAGTYYVYKTVNGMVNISKIPGVPGAWVNPNGTKAATTTTQTKTTTTTKTTTGTTTGTSLSAAQQKIVNAVKGALGTPYVYGGESYAEGGFDCSGLAQYAYAQAGIKIPRTSTSQLYGMQRVSAPQAGDLVIYSYRGDIVHTGIYVGDGQIIHAPDEGQVVSYHSYKFNTLDIVGFVRGY